MLDILTGLMYNDYSEREVTGMEWYLNPELHDEDSAELADLLAGEDGE